MVSEGSALLANGINATRIKPEESKYKYKKDDYVINWGNGRRANWFIEGMKILNDPIKVGVAIDKIASLTKMKQNGVQVPDFSTKIEDAKTWIMEGATVFCRTKIKGSGGDGIIISKTEAELVAAPLYVKYVKKKAEFRIAVVQGVVIDYMQKKKRGDWNVEERGEIDTYIRSHDRGWIMARENVHPPKCVIDQAINAIKSLELDFGSVDIIYNESQNMAYVLEVNSAPGLEENGTSLERYSKAFLDCLNKRPINSIIELLPQPAPIPAPEINNIPPAPPVKKAVPQQINPAPQQENKHKIIKIADAKDIEIVFHEGKVIVYGKVKGEFYPVKIATVNGENIRLSDK